MKDIILFLLDNPLLLISGMLAIVLSLLLLADFIRYIYRVFNK